MERKHTRIYKNFLWVSSDEYIDLERGIVYVEELGRQQEYVPYITLKSNVAYSIWNGIYIRCYKEKNVYEGAFMCDLWKNKKDAFAEWWSAEYYECEGESMAVDKDLLGRMVMMRLSDCPIGKRQKKHLMNINGISKRIIDYGR